MCEADKKKLVVIFIFSFFCHLTGFGSFRHGVGSNMHSIFFMEVLCVVQPTGANKNRCGDFWNGACWEQPWGPVQGKRRAWPWRCWNRHVCISDSKLQVAGVSEVAVLVVVEAARDQTPARWLLTPDIQIPESPPQFSLSFSNPLYSFFLE